MNLDKISEKVNPILDRKEYVFNAEFDSATVSNLDAKKEITKILSADEGLVVIKKILQKFGVKNGRIYAYLYLNKETLGQIEVIHKKAKKKEVKTEAKAA